MADEKTRSDLENAVDDVGRMVTGLAGRLFGAKAVEKVKRPEGPAISPEVDEAIGQVGDAMGRFLHAAGEGMKKHPLDPLAALDEVGKGATAPAPAPEGWSELSGGIKTFAQGLGSVAEGVLDVVAPKKPKADDAEDPGASG